LTKLHNDELLSITAADLFNYVVNILASLWPTRTNSLYRKVQPLATGKMRTADLKNAQ